MATAPADDQPRSLHDPAERQRRLKLLDCPHMRPLQDYVNKLRQAYPDVQVPDFDPLDGGVNAQVLFLFQKAGKQTVGPTGSGFISRNNNDDTAEAAFKFMDEAGIPRERTITWNVVPWWNGCNDVTPADLRAISAGGHQWVKQLLCLLPRLRAVVLVGGKAQELWPAWLRPDLRVFSSAHPSPVNRAFNREQWDAIPQEWAKVRAVLDM